jgi:phosphoenolpyruvate-protein phosphotransferase
MTGILLGAPFAGWAASLDQVPDPVFADRMMGEGVAVDPLEDVLRAPCDAEVIAVAPTAHSLTLRLANGAELLIHIGLETVALAGEGFAAQVEAGAWVRQGDVLIRFDIEEVAARAASLLTPMVIASEGYRVTRIGGDRVVAAGEPLLEVTPARQDRSDTSDQGGATATAEIVVAMANGVHARPAARIVAALRPFQAEMRFAAHGRDANARSAVSLLTLGLKQGDRIAVAANGRDAEAAVAAIVGLIESGMGEGHAPPVMPTVSPEPVAAGPVFKGVRAAPGLALGPVARFHQTELAIPEQATNPEQEAAALDAAIASLGAELADGGELEHAHRALLDDPELLAAARRLLAEGKSAGFAWRAATRTYADAIRATGDPLLIERIEDLSDVERRVIARILGEAAAPPPPLPAGAILVADELLPSQFLALDAQSLGGIVTARGGPTSHVAILAAAAGVPMLVCCGAGVLDVSDGSAAFLDADAGAFDSRPDPAVLETAAGRLRAAKAKRTAEAEAAHADCVTADGIRIEIFANLASAEDAERAVRAGAEGCGLLRTEFLFLDRDEPPSEAEQRDVYARIAAALGGRPLIVRTLDIGGDKPVPYLPFPHEPNPALGRRGIRLGLARPDLLSAQLRAILAAVPAAQCRVMLPMIVDRDELRTVRALFDEAAHAVGMTGKVPLGVMIETPAAALLSASIAAEADFLSVGTNDLSQYALAADRGNPAVADRIDALHPSVLRLIAEAAKGAAAHGRWLGVCGGLASDPAAAPILIGLGVTELSAAPAVIPALKAKVRGLDLASCRALAARALDAASAPEVRALLEGEN